MFANLGWDDVRLPAPVFEGDTIYSQSTVFLARPSRSHPEAGIVKVRTIGYNQRGTVVITSIRTLLVYRRKRTGCGSRTRTRRHSHDPDRARSWLFTFDKLTRTESGDL